MIFAFMELMLPMNIWGGSKDYRMQTHKALRTHIPHSNWGTLSSQLISCVSMLYVCMCCLHFRTHKRFYHRPRKERKTVRQRTNTNNVDCAMRVQCTFGTHTHTALNSSICTMYDYNVFVFCLYLICSNSQQMWLCIILLPLPLACARVHTQCSVGQPTTVLCPIIQRNMRKREWEMNERNDEKNVLLYSSILFS